MRVGLLSSIRRSRAFGFRVGAVLDAATYGANLIAPDLSVAEGSWSPFNAQKTAGKKDVAGGSTGVGLYETATTGLHTLSKTVSAAGTGFFRLQAEWAPDGDDWLSLNVNEQTFQSLSRQAANLSAGLLGNLSNASYIIRMYAAAITPLANGFYRLTLDYEASSGVTNHSLSVNLLRSDLPTASFAGDIARGAIYNPASFTLRKLTSYVDIGDQAISPALIAKAQKVVNAATAYTTRGYMATAPTFTGASAANAASTIAGVSNTANLPSVLFNDARLKTTVPVAQANATPTNGFVGQAATGGGTTLTDGGNGWGCKFKTVSRFIELSYFNAGNFGGARFARLRVNGEWAQVDDYVLFQTTDAAAARHVKWDLGSQSAQPRTIEVFFGNIATPVGFNFDVGTAPSLPDALPNDPISHAYGASYVAGTFGAGYVENNIRNTLCQAFGELMGIDSIVSLGRGGQGFITLVDARTITDRILLDAGRLPAPDIIYVFVGINDATQPAAQAQASIAYAIRYLKKAYRESIICVFTGFAAQNAQTDAAHFTAYRNGALFAADGRVVVVDTSGLPMVTNTGNLPDGNLHDSLDNSHPGTNEKAYMSAQLKALAVAAIKAKFGI